MQKANKPKVVIDTNLLISAILVPESPPDRLIIAWLNGLFILFFSKDQLEDVAYVSKRDKFSSYYSFQERIDELIENISFAAEITEPLTQISIHSRDSKDDFFLATALGADADYLVTGDEDLLVLNNQPVLGKLKIVKVSEFLKLD